MAIKIRHKRNADFNSSSMSDLVFLLLIFFMLTSTLVSPPAIKLLLPKGDVKTVVKPASLDVSIDSRLQYYVDQTPVDEAVLTEVLRGKLVNEKEAVIKLSVNFDVPTQHIVNVYEAVNKISKEDPDRGREYKVILATSPR